jgi:hypothetical protein
MKGAGAMRNYQVITVVALCGWPLAIAECRTLEVGPGKTFALPSQAAAVAQGGDVVQIAPGNYIDCAVWNGDDLTIEATGPGVVLSDKSCERKGIFVINGNDVIVRGITFRGAVVPDRNGAGIRAQGGNLTVERSSFLENQMGMLATGSLGGTVIVRDSLFARNGNCYPQCPDDVYMHALYAGRAIKLLRVERSEFVEQHDGHYIKSRALRSEIVDNVIHDGEKGTGSYLIDIPDGGTLIASGNEMEKGPNAENQDVTIAIGEESQNNPTAEIRVENNHFNNRDAKPTNFIWNFTMSEPSLRGNLFQGEVVPVAVGHK